MQPIHRRRFLKQSTTLSAGLAVLPHLPKSSAAGANRRVRIAIMGCNGRGMAHISSFLRQPDVEISYICDVDQRAIDSGVAAVKKKQSTPVKGVTDFRSALEDPDLDALSIATPNHWHAPATILACSAGKHVYVEKPCCYDPHEGELMVAAARKHRRLVQMGNQRRSWPRMIEAMRRLHSGELGRLYFARTWYNNHRPSIGKGNTVAPPDWLNYDLWQGPAPVRPYKDNLIHYNWHWHWHWGNGELGNNGIHALDVARWGLQVDAPLRVTCGGNRYHFNDDQETPDIYVTSYDFGNCGASWESHSCDPYGFEHTGFGITFYGEKGTLVIAGSDCRIYDLNNKEIGRIEGKADDVDHFANFIDAIRDDQPLTSEIAEGVKSTFLCHIGNIAYRTGRTIQLDPKTGRIQNDPEAERLWGREYRPGWEPKV